MLFLAKLLPVFVLPIGMVVALVLVGLVRKKRWPVALALVLLYVTGLLAATFGPALRYAQNHPRELWGAAVVVSAGMLWPLRLLTVTVCSRPRAS